MTDKNADLIARARYAIKHGNADGLHADLLAEVERLRAVCRLAVNEGHATAYLTHLVG
ncbi:hypothetical protein [Mycobacteroides chelonae]|uniref:hypothetical protein n=1 Tax=Mycobacteroides chelonae TaxID=1774 RepID=UPI0013F4C403|nr:hypothetical protein [Mycobacteroides chelonae]